MRAFLLPIVAFAALAPAAAVAAPARASFQFDGQTCSYSVERTTDGALRLVGDIDGGESFRLTVVKNRVEGQMGLTPVSFLITDAAMAKLAAEVDHTATTKIASN